VLVVFAHRRADGGQPAAGLAVPGSSGGGSPDRPWWCAVCRRLIGIVWPWPV